MIQEISWIVLVLLISTPLVVSAQVGKRFKSEYPDAKGLSLDPNFSEGFGTAVSILDGEAFIGESRGGSLVSGNVTVLLRGGDGTWSRVDSLVANPNMPLNGFGEALDADGDLLIVAAPFEDAGNGTAMLRLTVPPWMLTWPRRSPACPRMP